MTDLDGLIARLEVNARSWRRDDAMEAREPVCEAELTEEAIAAIRALRQSNERTEPEKTPVKEYRGYHVYFDPPPIPVRNCDWAFVHKDYDGPEDRRCGFAASEEQARSEIDTLEDDQ